MSKAIPEGMKRVAVTDVLTIRDRLIEWLEDPAEAAGEYIDTLEPLVQSMLEDQRDEDIKKVKLVCGALFLAPFTVDDIESAIRGVENTINSKKRRHVRRE